MESIEIKRIIKIAMKTGRLMLQNGAETYRVEDTVKRMSESRGLKEVSVFVIPTGIIFSADLGIETFTGLERVNPEGIDLESIDRSNNFARQFTSTDMSLDEAEKRLSEIENPPKFSKLIRVLGSGFGGGFFVLMFGGSAIEFLLAYIASSMTIYITDTIDSKHLNFFIRNIIGGFAAALLSLLFVKAVSVLMISASIEKVIVGPLMTLVPGVSLTNGIRDLISGELLAGSAKIMEALFIAIALAFGVGVILQFFMA